LKEIHEFLWCSLPTFDHRQYAHGEFLGNT
jgi:hypothetical protein